MSHSLGALKFKDGTIRYYEYNGTSDVVISCHYETVKEVTDNWRSYKWKDCDCDNEEGVSIYTSYGGGYYIEGKACKKCNSVRSNEIDFDIIESDETEHWAIELSTFKDD